MDMTHNDVSATRDSLSFIKQFYADWPELLKNPLFISGWSYGGVFAPYLTWEIHSYNQELGLAPNSTSP